MEKVEFGNQYRVGDLLPHHVVALREQAERRVISEVVVRRFISDLRASRRIFAAIEEIKEYEQDNFGQVSTDLSSSEKVVNMYAYIKGEEILADCPTLQANWDKRLSEEDIAAIKEELENLL